MKLLHVLGLLLARLLTRYGDQMLILTGAPFAVEDRLGVAVRTDAGLSREHREIST
jgi:hypothetical protein